MTAALVSTAAVMLSAAGAGTALAQTKPSEIAEERAAIDAERQRADSAFSKRIVECHKIFLTTDCVNEANAEKRRIRIQLKERESAINQIERKQRAAARIGELEKRQAQAAASSSGASGAGGVRVIDDKARAASRRGKPAADAARASEVEPDAAAPSDSSGAASGPNTDSAGDRGQTTDERRTASKCSAGHVRTVAGCVPSTRAAEQAAALQRRQQEADEHKAALARRLAKRDPAKTGQPLAVPAVIPPASAPR